MQSFQGILCRSAMMSKCNYANATSEGQQENANAAMLLETWQSIKHTRPSKKQLLYKSAHSYTISVPNTQNNRDEALQLMYQTFKRAFQTTVIIYQTLEAVYQTSQNHKKVRKSRHKRNHRNKTICCLFKREHAPDLSYKLTVACYQIYTSLFNHKIIPCCKM